MVAASHAGEIWAGRPAKLLRKLEQEEMAFICRSADNYAVLAADHAIENAKTFPEVGIELGSWLSSYRRNRHMHGAVDGGGDRMCGEQQPAELLLQYNAFSCPLPTRAVST